MDIRDQFGKPINIKRIEAREQQLAKDFITENDVVLELGARYGSVSCIINSKLNNKLNQVVVEPDERVWSALEENKKRNNCEFHIVKGFVSNKKLSLTNLDICLGGYGSTCVSDEKTTIPSYTLDEIKQKYNLKFDVLVADCEGFLEVFFDENPDFYSELKMIIFEADYPEKCNYQKIRDTLKSKNFKEIHGGYQSVYVKNHPIFG